MIKKFYNLGYSPTHDLVSSGAVCISPTTNNITEYEAVIGLLTKAASQDIHDLVVFMDSVSGLSFKPGLYHQKSYIGISSIHNMKSSMVHHIVNKQ